MCRVRENLDDLFPNDGQTELGRDESFPDLPGYEIESELGRGGMGVVYRAKHHRLDRTVAVKMLPTYGHIGPRDWERFRRETLAIAALRHQNVVQIYAVGEVAGQPYFTVEHVEGRSLAQKLTGQPVAAREAAQLVATLSEAVQAAHDKGIIHRDLKPGNVLLTRYGTPEGRRLRPGS
jgi:eukaryotic-like serine/threonine-protein kinase